MQTFITDHNISNTAECLDYRRLGKQRVEAIQIARCLLLSETKLTTNGWANHSAVKMWKGYESYLIKVYLYDIMLEWVKRGYKNEKCYKHYKYLLTLVNDDEPVKPYWIDDNFIEAHRSNLIAKYEEFYLPLWPDTQRNLPYVWPV